MMVTLIEVRQTSKEREATEASKIVEAAESGVIVGVVEEVLLAPAHVVDGELQLSLDGEWVEPQVPDLVLGEDSDVCRVGEGVVEGVHSGVYVVHCWPGLGAVVGEGGAVVVLTDLAAVGELGLTRVEADGGRPIIQHFQRYPCGDGREAASEDRHLFDEGECAVVASDEEISDVLLPDQAVHVPLEQQVVAVGHEVLCRAPDVEAVGQVA